MVTERRLRTPLPDASRTPVLRPALWRLGAGGEGARSGPAPSQDTRARARPVSRTLPGGGARRPPHPPQPAPARWAERSGAARRGRSRRWRRSSRRLYRRNPFRPGTPPVFANTLGGLPRGPSGVAAPGSSDAQPRAAEPGLEPAEGVRTSEMERVPPSLRRRRCCLLDVSVTFRRRGAAQLTPGRQTAALSEAWASLPRPLPSSRPREGDPVRPKETQPKGKK
ncbi:uncharacterized protein LOC113837278 [Cricetulus griseus]|uniref:Uncharacterized protein LOC113837278 n=1 Tax=Cricetulus griseus TaxID=10029 RepID=A0A9J7JZQ8_CRIGR|nr:uncharacterized protein LOC113837278 [Cricetulus griseus]